MPVLAHSGSIDYRGRSQLSYRIEAQGGYLFEGKKEKLVGTASFSLKYDRAT